MYHSCPEKVAQIGSRVEEKKKKEPLPDFIPTPPSKYITYRVQDSYGWTKRSTRPLPGYPPHIWSIISELGL